MEMKIYEHKIKSGGAKFNHCYIITVNWALFVCQDICLRFMNKKFLLD
jgi:hypothetical protein